MNRFLKNILHFSVYLLLINMACFGVIKTTYYDEYTPFNGSFSTYLFADSHGHQLDTLTEASGIFNFADPSDSYEDMLRKVKYTVAHSEVKKILLSADVHTMSTYREDNNNLDRSTIYATRADYKSSYDQFLQQYLRRYVPLLNGKSRDAILMHLKSLIPRPFNPELTWEEKTTAQRKARARIRANIHFENSERSEKLEKLIEEIILICRENDIELLGVKFPLTSEYLAEISGKGYSVEEILTRNHCKVLDFSHLFEGKSEYFRDQDHLNTLGASVFMPVLKKEINSP
ncbi:MAG: hypothetical protein AAF489_13660 [Bacteroidota bacterium]